MFDDVVYPEGECWKCKYPMMHFQSKDGECVMAVLQPEDVQRFYGICPECEAWNEYRVVPVGGVRIERVEPEN